ncbi:hypothetical protein [Streptomyces roseoviridis]|uniref:Uncharacterized protein n=1 Tax=Streptomyces roseoviridis TaxID=67361 RepID=A0ABV5R0Q2_9ACTN
MPKTTATPPPAAVAKDAHWAAKLERLRSRKPATSTLTICDDHTVRQTLAEAQERHTRARTIADAHPDEPVHAAALKAAEDALAQAQAAFDAEAIVLTFRALPRTEFEEMKAAHPPTEEQAEDGQIVNVETLGPELIAAACVDGLTVDDARFFLTDWAAGEAAQLFHAAWDIQTVVRGDLGKG